MEQQKRTIAAALLVLGLLAVMLGFGAYQSAKSDADRANHINQLVGDPNEGVDMSWPLVLWVGGGFAVLCSVILFAGARDEPDRERAEAPPLDEPSGGAI